MEENKLELFELQIFIDWDLDFQMFTEDFCPLLEADAHLVMSFARGGKERCLLSLACIVTSWMIQHTKGFL